MSLTGSAVGNGTGPSAAIHSHGSPPGGCLAARLATGLTAASVQYCQWKGSWKRSRWSVGQGDIDLLVDRASRARFDDVMARLGFRAALLDPTFAIPGAVSYLAPDPDSDRMIHVHAYYKLVVGRSGSTLLHLPLEHATLQSAARGAWFDVPKPEYELLLLTLQSTLRHEARALLRRGEPRWLAAIQPHLRCLEDEVDRYELAAIVEQFLPELSPGCFHRCRAALREGAGPLRRLLARTELLWQLRLHVHRASAAVLARRVWRRLTSVAGKRASPRGRKRLATGGAVIALAGPDGAGKSTCARSLREWLGAELHTCHAHLGRPPRSLTTLVVGGMSHASHRFDRLRGARRPSTLSAHLQLMRFVCKARDRYRLYRHITRFASAGGIAVCERYPVPEEHVLVGPSWVQDRAMAASGRLATRLRRIEASYYDRIAVPDLLIILRVNPATAVRRKPDEPEPYVRERARLVADIDWSRQRAQVVDAERPLRDVERIIRDHVWEAL
jgi:thymidylate kinase